MNCKSDFDFAQPPARGGDSAVFSPIEPDQDQLDLSRLGFNSYHLGPIWPEPDPARGGDSEGRFRGAIRLCICPAVVMAFVRRQKIKCSN